MHKLIGRKNTKNIIGKNGIKEMPRKRSTEFEKERNTKATNFISQHFFNNVSFDDDSIMFHDLTLSLLRKMELNKKTHVKSVKLIDSMRNRLAGQRSLILLFQNCKPCIYTANTVVACLRHRRKKSSREVQTCATPGRCLF